MLKKYIYKLTFYSVFCSMVLCGINIVSDPAHLFSDKLIIEMVKELSKGNIISFGNANIDERAFQVYRIPSLNKKVNTIIIGSSRIMYLPISEEETCYNAGVSSAILDDLYGLIGILEANKVDFNHLIIAIDPWIFNPNTFGVEYKSIIPYINYEKDLCDGNFDSAEKKLNEWNWQFSYEKLKTAYSPAYFRSALYAIRKKFSVESEMDKRIGRFAKITPCGQRIPGKDRLHSVDRNEMGAKKDIMNNNVYYIKNYRNIDKTLTYSFEKLIQHVMNRNIKITFFLPAWYPAHYKEIQTNSMYAGVLQSEKYILDFAKQNSITVRGSYNPAVTGLVEKDFMDTLHLLPEKLLEEYSYIQYGCN